MVGEAVMGSERDELQGEDVKAWHRHGERSRRRRSPGVAPPEGQGDISPRASLLDWQILPVSAALAPSPEPNLPLSRSRSL